MERCKYLKFLTGLPPLRRAGKPLLLYRSRVFRLLSLFILLGLALSTSKVFAQFNRSTGLINIPTGMNSLKEGDFEEGAAVSFSSDTFSLNAKFNYAINDRSEIGFSIMNENTARLNFHWQAMGMQRMLVAIGIQNIPLGGINSTPSFLLSPYVVASLYFPQVDMYFHIGQGGGRFLKESGQSSAFNGVFCGMEKTIRTMKLLFDYDGNYANLGIRYSITPTIILEGAAIRLNDSVQGLAACIGVSFIQPPARKSIADLEKKIEAQVVKKIEDLLPEITSAIGAGSLSETMAKKIPRGIRGPMESETTLNNLALGHAQEGTRYYYQGEYEKAVDSFKMAISLNPNFALFHSQLGSVYYKLKMFDSALVEWEQAYGLNPNDKQLKDFIENFKRMRQR